MGCLCPQKINVNNKNLNQKLNDEPAPTELDIESNQATVAPSKFQDLPEKRKLAEFLLSKDLNIFKRHLEVVRTLNDEDFYELFKGNTEYHFKVTNEKEFRQLAQKFEDNYELTIECYMNEEYYNYALQLWRPNIIQKLKSLDNEEEQNKLLLRHKINIKEWDENFQEIFKTIIDTKPLKSLAERMKNYIESDYGNFDELIKNVNNCKKRIEKDESTHTNKTIRANIETYTNKLFKEILPKFKDEILGEVQKIPSIFKEQEKNKAIDTIKNNYLSDSDEKRLIEEVTKIYEKKEEFSIGGLFNASEEYKKLEDLSEKFNEDHFLEDPFLSLEFDKITLGEKAEIFFKNKMIKHAILGLSIANTTYSILHMTSTLMNYNKFSEEFKKRYEDIKKNFETHKSKVKLIPEDIDEAIKETIECGQNFQSDLNEVSELINDIKNEINNVKTDKNTTTLNMVGSAGGLIIGILGMATTKGNDSIEYATASISDVVALVANGADLYTQNKALEEYGKCLTDAKELKQKINEEIDKLKKKFEELKSKHFS